MESLWAGLNKIFSSVRTATLAHRAEILDDHACDSNHKKALNMATYLCSRKKTAKEKHAQYKEYFENLCKTFGKDLIDIWTRNIVEAEGQRINDVSVMDIYVPQVIKRLHFGQAANIAGMSTAGSMHNAGGMSAGGSVQHAGTSVKSWLEFAFVVEEMQCVF